MILELNKQDYSEVNYPYSKIENFINAIKTYGILLKCNKIIRDLEPSYFNGSYFLQLIGGINTTSYQLDENITIHYLYVNKLCSGLTTNASSPYNIFSYNYNEFNIFRYIKIANYHETLVNRRNESFYDDLLFMMLSIENTNINEIPCVLF